MNHDDATKILYRYGAKLGRRMLMEQRVKLANTELVRIDAELKTMEVHVLTAMNFIESNPVPPPEPMHDAPERTWSFALDKVDGHPIDRVRVTEFADTEEEALTKLRAKYPADEWKLVPKTAERMPTRRVLAMGQSVKHKLSGMFATIVNLRRDPDRYEVETPSKMRAWWDAEETELAPLAAGQRVSWEHEGRFLAGHVVKREEISTHLDRDIYEVEREIDLQHHVTIERGKLVPIPRFQAGHGG